MYFNELIKLTNEKNVLKNESLSKHCTFKIGGSCEYLVFPESQKELTDILKLAKEENIPLNIIGNGSNVLFSDDFHKGIVIKTTHLDEITVNGNEITAFCGAKLSQVCNVALKNSLSGMEELNGIPGTIGGAVYMNAGAYGGEMAQIVESVEVMDAEGNVETLSNADMHFSYRHSVLEESDKIVVSALLKLTPAPAEEVKAKMKELIGKRTASQPLDYPSAGSAFKRPVGGYAAALIDEAGMKGYRVGGAAISEKHAGFAVNLGGATAEEVKQLLKEVAEKVYANSGIRIEPEIRIW